MIRATGITVRRGGRAILDEVDCSIQPGRVTVAMGKNGAGKSTLLNVLAGTLGADAGAVNVDGRGLADYAPAELAGKRAVLAQSAHLGFPLSVVEVVELGCYHRYDQLSTRQRVKRVHHYLELLELTSLSGRAYPTLSGGEKKRVLLAKCLLQLDGEGHNSSISKRYLLLDEPTAALDVEQQYRFVQLATRLARERGLGVFAVLHDLNLAARCADELLFLRDGKVIASGDKTTILNRTTIRAAFDVDCLIQPHPHLEGPLITTIPYEQPNFAPAVAPQ